MLRKRHGGLDKLQQRKKEEEHLEEGEIRSHLLILDLKDGQL